MSWATLVLRSLLGRPRTLLIALLAAGVAALLTVGATLIGSVYEGTRRSIIESGAGHLQIYNAKAPNPPTVIAGPGGVPDLPVMADFPAAEALVRGVPGVQDVVPMELAEAEVFRGNYLDDRLQELRTLVGRPASPERDAAQERLIADLRRVLREIARDARHRDELFTTGKAAQEDQRALDEAASDAFWQRFPADPLSALEFLENRVSKQLGEGEAQELDVIGTDIAQFARAFPRVELISGQLPAPGQRGILLGEAFYEQSFKLPMALRLDEVSRARQDGGQISGDERLRALLDRNFEELPYFLLELSPERAEPLRAALSRVLGHAGELEPLLREFLTLDDANFDARYRAFYSELAPRLRMYRIAPGDMLIIRPLKDLANIQVKVFGTFRFRGLGADQDRVNSVSLLDPVSTQILALRQTRAQAAEVKQTLAAMGMPEVPAASEIELRPAQVEDAEVPATPAPEPVFERRANPDTFTHEDVVSGGVLQAAVVLAPGVEPDAVAAEISARAKAHNLSVATADWSQVGGIVSQVVHLSRMALLLAAVVLGLIVVLVSTGALVLMASERVSEVGTLRAIGMQRGEVLTLMLLEGLVLGGAGALLGAGAAALILGAGMGSGIAVSNGSLQFFLGGPRLVPRLDSGQLLLVAGAVLAEVVLASLWPAWRGSAVSPRVAMTRGSELS